MAAMLRALLLAIGDLREPVVLRVFVKSLALTIALFAITGAALWWGIAAAIAPWTGDSSGALAAVMVTAIEILSLWLLFRAIAIAAVGLFADEMVEAVERRHYPAALADARPLPFHRAAAMGLRSAGRVVAVNLLMAPVYIALLVTGIGTGAAFLLVNGWLLGRDLGDMVAVRHLETGGIKAWRGTTGGRRFLLGLAGTVLLTIPFVNLFAPVLGAAMATHLFHARRS